MSAISIHLVFRVVGRSVIVNKPWEKSIEVIIERGEPPVKEPSGRRS